MAASRVRKAGQAHTLPRTEQDIPIGTVALVSLLCLLPVVWLLWHFSMISGLGSKAWELALCGVVFVAIMGFLVSTVCGYMAGLIGSSNSPLSGIGILVVVVCALLLVFEVKGTLPASAGKALVAFALFVTAVVFAVASIANNNLQDLKTGQLVDATPALQQWALVVGVIAGALVIPPVLDLVNHAYGFLGAPGVNPAHALPAPQAGLISALAQGVIQNNVDWSALGVGGLIGVGCIVFDETSAPHGQGERGVSAAARRRPRDIPAAHHHAHDLRRRDRRLGVQSPRRARPQVRGDATARRAARFRPHRRRESARRGVRRGGRLLGQFLSHRPGRRALRRRLSLWLGGVAFAIIVWLLYRWVGRLARE